MVNRPKTLRRFTSSHLTPIPYDKPNPHIPTQILPMRRADPILTSPFQHDLPRRVRPIPARPVHTVTTSRVDSVRDLAIHFDRPIRTKPIPTYTTGRHHYITNLYGTTSRDRPEPSRSAQATATVPAQPILHESSRYDMPFHAHATNQTISNPYRATFLPNPIH